MKGKEVVHSSNSDEWATPQSFYDKLDKIFNFQLDPATDGTNNKTKFYLEDSLEVDWKKHCEIYNLEPSIFVNPPYSQIGKWVEKCYKEAMNGCTVVMLIPARTDTKWWSEFCLKASEVWFIKGRLKFGNSVNSAPFPSAVVIFENNRKPFYVKWHDRELNPLN